MPTRSCLALLSLALLAACGPDAPRGFTGYVEGEYLYLAAPQSGYLQSLDAPRGSRVTTGQPLFALAADPDDRTLAEAEARAGSARGKLQNLETPRRAPEIAALEANLRAAEAARELAHSRLAQQQALARQNFVAKARLDEAQSAFDQARAQVDASRQQLQSYRATLGREAEIQGAKADLEAAKALAAQKRWLVERKTMLAPTDGEIAQTYYRPGEWVGAGAPVASLLPDSRRRLRFFVPETALAGIRPGQKVVAHCDGCKEAILGTIDFIAPQAEYTPPVIYSRGSREKLVFRIEAAPDLAQAPTLRPGLPVDVRLEGQ